MKLRVHEGTVDLDPDNCVSFAYKPVLGKIYSITGYVSDVVKRFRGEGLLVRPTFVGQGAEFYLGKRISNLELHEK